MAQMSGKMFADINTPTSEAMVAERDAVRAYIFDGWNFTPLADKVENHEGGTAEVLETVVS